MHKTDTNNYTFDEMSHYFYLKYPANQANNTSDPWNTSLDRKRV